MFISISYLIILLLFRICDLQIILLLFRICDLQIQMHTQAKILFYFYLFYLAWPAEVSVFVLQQSIGEIYRIAHLHICSLTKVGKMHAWCLNCYET